MDDTVAREHHDCVSTAANLLESRQFVVGLVVGITENGSKFSQAVFRPDRANPELADQLRSDALDTLNNVHQSLRLMDREAVIGRDVPAGDRHA